MSYISWNKKELVNLEHSLNREVLRSNALGAFLATTVIGCNTRKYHGLLVVPQPQLDNNNHVLLSSLDETIIENKEEFHLGVHMYPDGVFAPRGHKYIRDFTADPMPKLTYRIGNVVLDKELIFSSTEARLFVRYTLRESMVPITLRVLPFLAFRNVHMLTHENYDANHRVDLVKNGASWQLYKDYSRLYLQFSKAAQYTHVPHWYYNMFYIREQERGYEAAEDQFVPGFFELQMKQGDTVILSASLEEQNPTAIKRQCEAEVKRLLPQTSYEDCLLKAAQQFIIRDAKGTRLWAGFPWFGSCSRDTFLSLPGIALAQGDEKTFNEVLQYLVARMQGPFFPHRYYQKSLYFTAVDSPLWFFWVLQMYEKMCGKDKKDIWRKCKKPITVILESFIGSTDFNVHILDNGLLYAGNRDLALTWMNVFAQGKPWTPRTGLAIEVNALWYNALRYAVELLKVADPKSPMLKKWNNLADKVEIAFNDTFVNKERNSFYDFVNSNEKNMQVRPNMMLAAALPFTPMTETMQKRVFDITHSELLTPRGIRSLSPNDEGYKGVTIGNHSERERAYHNGTAFPWLISFYADLSVKLFGKSALASLEEIYMDFEGAIKDNGIGTISEIYDGNPPFEARGCISQSTSVGALLYLRYLIDELNKKGGSK
ncbi:MAG: glycogen debranching enzyme family protein [Bacteroidales bacterium]|nr:glycogen debranching enzyme family protein [Bacteroidales bacterium]